MNRRRMPVDVEAVARTCICLHTRMAARAVTRAFNHALRETGLEVTEMTLLAALTKENAGSIAELAERLAFERTTLVRNLKALVGKGYVSAEPGGGRAVRHRVTAAGEAALEAAMPIWRGLQDRFEACVDEPGWAKTRRALRAIRKSAQGGLAG